MIPRCTRLVVATRRSATRNLRPPLPSFAGGSTSPAHHGRCHAPATHVLMLRSDMSAAPAAAVAPRVAEDNPTKQRRLTQQERQVLKTPPVESLEETGTAIREMRVQLRNEREQGSRGSRRVRRDGKVPGVVYSNNESSARGSAGETFCVMVDKLVVDREIRRLGASFDNTVYNLVIEGARPTEEDDEGIDVEIGSRNGAGGETRGEEAASATTDATGNESRPPERKELVLANCCRLHPVLRTLLSVNWIRYKPGRRYPIPIKFINDDLNESFKRGAYIRRLKTHQHIILPEDPAKVPKWLYLDLEFVRSGSKLRVSDIIIPDGIQFFRGNEPNMWNELVCTVKGKKTFVSQEPNFEEE